MDKIPQVTNLLTKVISKVKISSSILPHAYPSPLPHTIVHTQEEIPPVTTEYASEEPWMQCYTTWTFEHIHPLIYPITKKINEQQIHQQHPFS